VALVSGSLPLAGQIEELETAFSRKGPARVRRRNPQLATGDPPLDVIAGTKVQLLGERLWNTHLELTRDLRHFLTVARQRTLLIGWSENAGLLPCGEQPCSFISLPP
jgi:hypothetical protein